jgi:N-acetylglucosaminyldiphosphoundecaprenol N-acetyl-beta-D-mannosaminyltransferase
MGATAQEIRAVFGSLRLPANAGEAEHLIGQLTAAPGARILSFVNAHAVNLAVSDPRFRDALLQSDVLLRDGIGVKIGCALLGLTPGPNLNGTDLIPRLLMMYRGKQIALFGAEPEWLGKAAGLLRDNGHPDLVAIDGFQPYSAYIASTLAAKPALVILGMGMPKQERVAVELRAAANEVAHDLLIVNGGAILDFLAGKVARAPAWMRRAGLEWVHRLVLEPSRLARRYLLGNPIFLWRVVLARFRFGPGTNFGTSEHR